MSVSYDGGVVSVFGEWRSEQELSTHRPELHPGKPRVPDQKDEEDVGPLFAITTGGI
jgi:hypothetical protein